MPPRGGRGGAGAGRPRPPPGKVRIGGVDIEYEEDANERGKDNKAQPALVFPPDYTGTDPRPITNVERLEVERYMMIRERIRRGPFYTTLQGATIANHESKKRKARSSEPTFDAFNGVQTYSMKYNPNVTGNPPLYTRPFVLKFFPPELHSVIDTAATANGADASKRRKQLQTDFEDLAIAEVEGIEEGIEAKDEDEEATRKLPEDGDDVPDEDVDNDFEEDEDDDAGDDYNAEQYFDDGDRDEDMGDDDDGGGGDFD